MAGPNFDWQKELKKLSLTSVKLNCSFVSQMMVDILEPAFHRVHDLYLRATADKKSCQIIIALRRYKNKHGRWPESLDNLKSLVPAEVFVDPISGGSFVYKLTDANFTLYSKGKNNIDEDGQNNSRWDPNTGQRIVEQDDFLIWPHGMYDTQQQNRNAE
jgi:hypothetical protein